MRYRDFKKTDERNYTMGIEDWRKLVPKTLDDLASFDTSQMNIHDAICFKVKGIPTTLHCEEGIDAKRRGSGFKTKIGIKLERQLYVEMLFFKPDEHRAYSVSTRLPTELLEAMEDGIEVEVAGYYKADYEGAHTGYLKAHYVRIGSFDVHF